MLASSGTGQGEDGRKEAMLMYSSFLLTLHITFVMCVAIHFCIDETVDNLINSILNTFFPF